MSVTGKGPLSKNAEAILRSIFEAGGSRDFDPDRAEAAAIRALENRGFVFFDDDAMRARKERWRGGQIYTLTDSGRIAAQIVRTQ